MTTAYTNLLGLALPVQGELTGTWGDTINNSITALLEDAIANFATHDVTSGNWTLTTTGSGVSNEARMAMLIVTGTPGTARTITAPAHSKMYAVSNQSNASITVKSASTSGATIATGKTAIIAWTGSDFVVVGTSSVDTGTTSNITGLLKGNGTSLSAATANTDYLTPTSTSLGTGVYSGGAATLNYMEVRNYPQSPSGAVTSLRPSNGASGEIFFGYYNSKPVLYNSTDNYMDLGANGTFNYSWKNIYLNNSPVITSDKRLKDHKGVALGLDFIKQLTPVAFTWKIGGYETQEGSDELVPIKGTRLHQGFFAQDVKAVADAMAIDFGGWISSDIADPEAQQSLRLEEFIAPIVKAIQEQQTIIEVLQARLAAIGG